MVRFFGSCKHGDCSAAPPPETWASHIKRGIVAVRPAIAVASIPYVLTFLVVAVLAWEKLFPLLSGSPPKQVSLFRKSSFKLSATPTPSAFLHYILDHAMHLTFAVTFGMSAVLAELLFCEISELGDPHTRKAVLELTMPALLVSLVIVIPALEVHSITSGMGLWKKGTKRLFVGLALDVCGFAAWLVAFWWVGHAVLHQATEDPHRASGLVHGALERIAIVGVSLMASLAGFAAVSSLWQTFGARHRLVTDTDLARKRHGIEAAAELLGARESRLRALERRMTETPGQNMFSRFAGSFRMDPDTQEMQSLKLEISGFETMHASLNNSLLLMESQHRAQHNSGSAAARFWKAVSFIFSIYCLYRLGATSTATLRRWWHPSSTFASTDPINNILALVAKHWDPTIDRAAWSRQISFALTGVMLLLSFNAVVQTVLIVSRLAPARFLHSARQNSALLVSQVSAVYVVSSALLLRSNLPREMGSLIEEALGSPLDTRFTERWFEGWFLGVSALTALAIFLGRKVGSGSGDFADEYDEQDVEGFDMESGKSPGSYSPGVYSNGNGNGSDIWRLGGKRRRA